MHPYVASYLCKTNRYNIIWMINMGMDIMTIGFWIKVKYSLDFHFPSQFHSPIINQRYKNLSLNY